MKVLIATDDPELANQLDSLGFCVTTDLHELKDYQYPFIAIYDAILTEWEDWQASPFSLTDVPVWAASNKNRFILAVRRGVNVRSIIKPIQRFTEQIMTI